MKLKILSKYRCFILMFMSIIIAYTITNINVESKYKLSDTLIKGYIHSIKIDANKMAIEVIGKEKIIGNYYFEKTDNINFNTGDYVEINCTLMEPKESGLFIQFSYKQYLKQNSIFYTMKIDSITKIKDNNKIRYHIKNFIIDRIESIPLSKKYLYAFIIGEEYYINSNVKDSYQINGISHLFAVSGSNITFVVLILLKLINKFKYKYVFIFAYVLLYMFLTDFTASIVRSGVFYILITLNKIYKKNIDIKDILCLTLIISLIYNPYLIYDVGYQFSFIISLYLICFQKLISKFKSYLGTSFIVAIIAFLSSLPIVLNNFYEFNLLSIIFNLIYVPFVSFILFPLSLITFILPIFDKVFYSLTLLLENTSLFFSNINVFKIILGKPHIILMIIYYIAITLILLKPKYTYLLIILLFINKISNYTFNSYIEFIDVGQGDSILLRLNNKSILIDTGGIMKYDKTIRINEFDIGKDLLLPYLKSKGIDKIDHLILTHGDYDHMGGSVGLVENYKVENVIFNVGEYNKLELELINELNKNKIKYTNNIDELSIEKYKILFLNTKEYNNENDNSIVIYLEVNGIKILLMGDAGIEKEVDILEKYSIKDVDILKIGHHGSTTSSSKIFIEKLNPKYCIISVGVNNKFGHPKQKVLDTLKKCNIYRTDLNGSIEIKIHKNKHKFITVK